jgi:sigma-54 dependent transcriptional regulator, acetoin dehydrogenase operon transcriptional activator AcoR
VSGEPLTLAQARAVQARGLALPPHMLPGAPILDSWVRCAERGLAADSRLALPVAGAAELARRREQAEGVRRLARAELETLAQQIAGSDFLLAFADRDGVILDLYADNRFAMSGSDAGILPGSCWSEAAAGTNGLGTALASRQAVAVTGPEHYLLRLSGVSCTAAPVHDAAGRIVGVLDASSHFEGRQSHTQALVQMAATHIENSLLTQQMQGAWVLALHPRAEYLGTLSAGLLAFDGEGRLAAINAPAQRLLAGLDCGHGTRFEVLFAEPMEHLLARLHHGGDARLRDALGSALVARLVHRPAAPAPRPASRPVKQATSPRPAPAAQPAALGFLASDPAVAAASRLIGAAVHMGVPVLLQGETGTGKELLARHAHEASGRSGHFVAVNCAALPAELFEAELFGHAPGAFTGARREGHAGLIVQADGGTLLLDEVRELPLALQAALLRFLDDRCVRPLGGAQVRKVDVQLLAATHADLEADVREHRFREDLLYRLNTVRVVLPPLRERRDLAEAVRWVLATLAPHAAIDEAAIAPLLQHRWPGNFRELRSVLTRVLLARGDNVQAIGEAEVLAQLPAGAAPAASSPASALQRTAGELVRTEYERSGHSVSRTARALGVSRTTVYRHLGHLKPLTPG